MVDHADAKYTYTLFKFFPLNYHRIPQLHPLSACLHWANWEGIHVYIRSIVIFLHDDHYKGVSSYK